MPRLDLDAIDCRIIAALQAHGRLSSNFAIVTLKSGAPLPLDHLGVTGPAPPRSG